jgi:hypothetical protein
MSKWVGRSRALWAAVIPLVVACAALAGVDTENLAEDLDALGAAVILLVGSALGLWSRFWPDHAKLKGTPGALVILLAATLALGCATAPRKGGAHAGGMAEAYNVSGPELEVGPDGSIKCKTADPATHPCNAAYAGGWELLQPIIETLAVPFEAALAWWGRSLGAPAPAP